MSETGTNQMASADIDTIRKSVLTGMFTPRTWHGLPLEMSSSEGIRVEPEMCMPESMLWILNSGRSTVYWRDAGKAGQHPLDRDVAVFWRKGHALTDIRTTDPLSALAVFFPFEKLESWMHEGAKKWQEEINSLGPHVFRIDPFSVQVLRTIATEIDEACPSGAIFAETVSIALLTHLARTWQRQGQTTQGLLLNTPLVQRLKDYIEANLSEDLSLTELASLVAMSPRHMSRCFKQATGESLHQYVLNRRIARATQLLKFHDATEVAMITGFSSPSHFSSTFHRVVGKTPSQYYACK